MGRGDDMYMSGRILEHTHTQTGYDVYALSIICVDGFMV